MVSVLRNPTYAKLFAAQVSLSHACFLLTYPLAGRLGAAIGLPAVSLVLAGTGLFGVVLTLVSWKQKAVNQHHPMPTAQQD